MGWIRPAGVGLRGMACYRIQGTWDLVGMAISGMRASEDWYSPGQSTATLPIPSAVALPLRPPYVGAIISWCFIAKPELVLQHRVCGGSGSFGSGKEHNTETRLSAAGAKVGAAATAATCPGLESELLPLLLYVLGWIWSARSPTVWVWPSSWGEF